MGIAIPHAKTDAVKVPRVAVGVSKKGLTLNQKMEAWHILYL